MGPCTDAGLMAHRQVKESDEPKPDAANILAYDLFLMNSSRASQPVTWTSKGKPSKTEQRILTDEQQMRDFLLAFFINLVSPPIKKSCSGRARVLTEDVPLGGGQVGDASTYLRPDRAGKLQLDRDFYLGSREMLCDSPPLRAFLEEFVQSQVGALRRDIGLQKPHH
jgi:hypothetical protein